MKNLFVVSLLLFAFVESAQAQAPNPCQTALEKKIRSLRPVTQSEALTRNRSWILLTTIQKLDPSGKNHFETLATRIREALMHQRNLSYLSADAFAQNLRQLVLQTLGIGWHFAPLSRQALIEATHELLQNIDLDTQHDIPFLAGYSEVGGRIYIDRNIPREFRSQGKTYPVFPTLMVHEITEKAFIDEFGFNYTEAHQLAQRLETRVREAMGIPRKEYDQLFIDAYERIVSHLNDPHYENWPNDLDLTPYVRFTDPKQDADIISLTHRMKKARKQP